MIHAEADVRGPLIDYLHTITTKLVASPEAPKRAESVVWALGSAVAAYEEIVKAVHTSSMESYALKDLPHAEKIMYEQVKHNMRILGMLYGPQEAP